MNRIKPWRLTLCCLAWALSGVFVQARAANQPETAVQQLDQRYQAGSIQSVEAADAALREVAQARSSVLARHAAEEALCYPKFWISSCLEQAAEVKRNGLALVRRVEVEAARFKRAAKVREHDRQLEARRQEEEQNAPQRLIREQDFWKARAEKEAAQAKAVADEQAVRVREEETRQKEAQRQQQHDAKLQKIRARQQAEAGKRAENVAAYEKKQAAAKARQAEFEQKRLEREKKTEQKAEQKAGKATEKGASAAASATPASATPASAAAAGTTAASTAASQAKTAK